MSDNSVSLHSSKRKFYKLLDNLSSSRVRLPTHQERNASTTTLAAAQTTEPPTKRSRLLSRSRPTTAPSSPSRPITAGAQERPRSSIFSVNGKAKARPKSVVSERDVMVEQTKKTPNYAPWSHDQFLARLKTFADVKTWTPKPPAVGEVEWAKRGWTVVGKDTVGCKGGCEKRLVVRVADEENKAPKAGEKGAIGVDDDDWWMGDLEGRMVERYRDLIVAAHAEECLWRRAGSKDDIYRIKMADPATWQTELRERYLSLLAVEGSLPANLEVRTQDMEEGTTAFDVELLKDVVPADVLRRTNDFNSEEIASAEEPPLKVNTSALTLALTGWSGQSQSTIHLAYCAKCFQRAGLWLYSAKSSDTEEILSFNPIESHREHCPWKNAHSQAASGRLEGLTGWQVLITLIKGYRHPNGRSPVKKAHSRPASSYTQHDDEDDEDWTKGKEEQEQEDKERKSRLQKLKRAFSVRKGHTLTKEKEKSSRD